MSLVTAEQLAAQLRFELLDGAGESRLGHMTALGRAMKKSFVSQTARKYLISVIPTVCRS